MNTADRDALVRARLEGGLAWAAIGSELTEEAGALAVVRPEAPVLAEEDLLVVVPALRPHLAHHNLAVPDAAEEVDLRALRAGVRRDACGFQRFGVYFEALSGPVPGTLGDSATPAETWD